jgi:hypothetical protein
METDTAIGTISATEKEKQVRWLHRRCVGRMRLDEDGAQCTCTKYLDCGSTSGCS